jgi:C1A family cysteine protease
MALDLAYDKGIPFQHHFPYSSSAGNSPPCNKKWDDFGDERVLLKHYCFVFDNDNIKREIRKSGPVIALMPVYQDFLSYFRGVYKPHPDAKKLKGYQAVEIVGWGESNNTPFWMIKNSWGEEWGDAG